jgi:membrane protein implicated in regulation of membrane protease activity
VLLYVYLFTLIVGAILLGGSILLGGKDVDADGHGSGDKDTEVGGHGDFAGFLLSFLSLRFWTFAFAFFGLTGLVLELLDLVGNQWLTLGLALAMGMGIGTAATTILRKLGMDTSGQTATSADYIGKTARVVVPIEGKGVGKVRVDVKGTSVDLMAVGIDEEDFEGREEVLIVEMDGPRARVARVDAKTSDTKRR